MCWLHAISPFFFLFLFFYGSLDVEVPGVDDDGVAATLDLFLPLDIHVGSFLQS